MFKFKGISSKDMQVIIEEEEHFIARAARRYETIEIEGRDGAIFNELGYAYVERPIYVQCLNPDKIDEILSWLDGEGEFEYKGRKTTARFYSELEPKREGYIKIIDTTFIRDPFWTKLDDEFVEIKGKKEKTQESENINIKGTIPTKFKEFKLSGNSEQETRSGKNMINVLKESLTTNGVTFTNNKDGSITINGTATGVAYFPMNEQIFTVENGETYGLYLGGTTNGLNMAVRRISVNTNIFMLSNAQESIISTYNRETVDDAYAYLRVEVGTVLNNVTVYPMLVEGSEIGDYEPYRAMPSPEYPSKIQNVSTVNLVGGKWLNGLYDANGNFGLTSGVYRCFKKFLKAGTYVYSCNADIVRARSVNLTTNTILNVQTGNIFTLQEDAEISLGFRKTSGLEWDLGENLEDIEFQLEEGTVATEYKPNGINISDCNKNLAVIVNTTNKSYITMNGDGTFTVNGILEQNDAFTFITNTVLKKGNYRFSLGIDYSKANESYYNISANGEQLKFYNNTDVDFELKEDSTIKATMVFIAGAYNNLVIKPMIERTESEVSGDWVEHQEQTVLFPLAQGQKLMLGDYLADDGIHHVRKQIELDGTDFSLYSNQVAGRTIYMISAFSNNNNFKTYDSSILCNILKQGTSSNGNNYLNNNGSSGSLYVSIENSILGITDKSTNEEKLQAFQNLIAETGFVYEGELAEEETEAYTEEQQESYNQICNLKAYEEETNVYSENEVSPIFKVTYLEETTEKIENEGNIYSRPILRLEKTSYNNVDLEIAGTRFQYDFNNEEYVEIDCEEKTALYEGLNRNRKMTIGYEFPKLIPGSNDIKMYEGDCILKAKRKDRWL